MGQYNQRTGFATTFLAYVFGRRSGKIALFPTEFPWGQRTLHLDWGDYKLHIQYHNYLVPHSVYEKVLVNIKIVIAFQIFLERNQDITLRVKTSSHLQIEF